VARIAVTVRRRSDRIAPRINITTRWKVRGEKAILNAEISGSAALGRDNTSDSFPVRGTVHAHECTEESDFL
jgi:hypothetical protein